MQWISPRNHMVFTPLLASTAVGTLEFRSVALPVREIQRALSWPQNNYITASATSINPSKHEISCKSLDGLQFVVKFDHLVIATGAAGSMFGLKGVEEHAHFLRDVSHASRIRSKIMENLSLANTPGAPSCTHILVVPCILPSHAGLRTCHNPAKKNHLAAAQCAPRIFHKTSSVYATHAAVSL